MLYVVEIDAFEPGVSSEIWFVVVTKYFVELYELSISVVS